MNQDNIKKDAIRRDCSVMRFFSAVEATLFENLREFCSCFEYSNMALSLRQLINSETCFKPEYVAVTPDEAGFSAGNRFRNTSLFEDSPVSATNDIFYQYDGVEISCNVTDNYEKRARLLCGLALPESTHKSARDETLNLSRALKREIDYNLKPGLMRSRDSLSVFIHQLRNPLATVITAASQIESKTDDNFDDDDRMLMQFIITESERIEKFLNMYSRYNKARRLDIRQTRLVNLVDILREACGKIEADNVEVEFASGIADGHIFVDADPEKLSEALTQLVRNGIEALADQAGRIRVEILNDHNQIVIKVTDNGPGIRPEILRKVKEPFFSTKEGGSGLGLSMASRIASAHGGRLVIDSEGRRKTQVAMQLPCKKTL